MKRLIKIVFVIMVLCLALPNIWLKPIAHAETIEEKLEDETHSQIDDLDLGELEKLLDAADTGIVDVFDGLTFKALVKNIVDGKTTFSFGTFFSSCFNALSKAVLKIMPFVAVLLAVVLLSSIFARVKPDLASGQVGNVIFFATFAIVALLVAHMVASVVVGTTSALATIKKQMQAAFPVLLTLMTASGGAASVKIYQPAVGMLAGGVSSIFLGVLLPLFSVSIVLVIVTNLSDDVKVDKFRDLVSSVFKWVIGFMSTIFMAYLAVQGMTAATVDGVSIRTAKYAIKNYVPMLGGYISDGFEVVLASSMLIKNGIGLASLFLLLSTLLVPLFSIMILTFALKLVAAVTQPVADKKFVAFLTDISKTMNMLLVVLLGTGLMYFLSVALMIGTANNIL